MKRKPQAIIIASQGMNTSILCDGKLYWSEPIKEITFHHKAGECATINIACDRLPVVPNEDKRLKDNFRDWMKFLMEEFLQEDSTLP